MGIRAVSLVSITAAILVTVAPMPGLAQTSVDRPLSSGTFAAPDPLRVGKQALSRGDYSTAQTFFAEYLKDNSNDVGALFFAGNAALGLQQYDAAAQYFQEAIKVKPSLWPAHKNLVIVYAAQEKWSEFDQERKLLQDARASGAAGLNPADSDVIDVIHIGAERYIVRSYAQPVGRFHTRYNFTHFGPDGKLDSWISCESDDVDQVFFAKAHPKEAAAGLRSFSLDSYTAMKPTADGKGYTQTQALIKFYPDGEPTYETVRADVLNVLEHKTGSLASTTSSAPAAAPDVTAPATAASH